MAFGVYVHIPYCRQICPYCDFSKYEFGTTLPPDEYVELLRAEIRARAPEIEPRPADSIYFGGGTPSAIEPHLILAVLDELAKAGFGKAGSCEMTIEIDPDTIDADRLARYQEMGFNRFSVGAQSFNDRLLRGAGRRHDGKGSSRALELLARAEVNYSFDLLFALPTQTLAEAELDVRTALNFAPAHVSAYCLTVAESHPMAKGRAPDEEQAEMFRVIEGELAGAGLERYEISNFAKPGQESRHNLLYWTDQPYWGLGVSAHSFAFGARFGGALGSRFWNPPSMAAYAKQIRAQSERFSFQRELPPEQMETLLPHQALTDFCHTSLRLRAGLSLQEVRRKFGAALAELVAHRLEEGRHKGWMAAEGERCRLTFEGQLLANLAFELTTFLPEDAPVDSHSFEPILPS